MNHSVLVPIEWVKSVSRLRLPPAADRRLGELLDRKNDGRLTEEERAQMESLMELSETLSLVRAGAFQTLGHRPE